MVIQNPKQLLSRSKELLLPEHVSDKENLDKTHLDERTKVRKETIEQLQKIANAEARVRMFAEIMDKYGADAIVGMFPEIGDLASSGVAGLYLIFEAHQADLSKADYLKIIGLQTADIFVGAVPLAGDVLDYLFKANKWSADIFSKKLKQAVADARSKGVSEAEIAKIRQSGEKLPQLVNKVVTLFGEEPKKAA